MRGDRQVGRGLRAQGLVIIALCFSVAAAGATELSPQQIYERAATGVVAVVGQSAEGGSRGTGSIIRNDGLVVTNAHVVINEKTGKPFENIWVFLKPQRVTGNFRNDLARGHKATVVAADAELDLALVKFEVGQDTFPVLVLGDPELVRIGDRMAAIGHPEQGGLWTLTTGVVSAEFEDFTGIEGKDVFQTETGLNRGNSGGPLLDGDAHLVGVNTSIARLAKDGLPITSISFAIKSSVAREWLSRQGVKLDYASEAVEREPVTRHEPVTAPPASSAPRVASPPKAEPEKPVVPAVPQATLPKTPAAPAPQGPQVHTDPHPFKEAALYEHIRRLESQMEDLAEEMRRKIPQR